jgi:excisionase family DNA binding protein
LKRKKKALFYHESPLADRPALRLRGVLQPKSIPDGASPLRLGVRWLPDQLMTFQETGREPVEKLPTASDPNDLLTPSDAARVLGLSPDSVRVLSDSGRLPALRTVSGRRLFRRGDVDRLAADRAAASAARIPTPPGGSSLDHVNGHANGHGLK